VNTGPVQKNIKEIIHGYKIGADNRRVEEAAIAREAGSRKVPEVLVTNSNGSDACPECQKTFKPQGITGHMNSCTPIWCKKNKIKMGNNV
jgi:predicted nucleic acid binding AN1-type Zn finger protein